MSDWLTLLPPLVAITLAIWTREVIISLLAGIWFAESLMSSFNPLLGAMQTLERVAGVFADPGNARILIFCLLIGALLELVRQSGGVRAFVDRLSHSPMTRGPRQVGTLTALVGTARRSGAPC